MTSLRYMKEAKTKIQYPRHVNSDDIKENGLLLTDAEITKTINSLKTQPDKRFTKDELKKLGLDFNYSIIKDENRYFVVYKKNIYLGRGGQGKVKIAQFIGSYPEDKNKKNWKLGKLLAIKVVSPKKPHNTYDIKSTKTTLEKEQKLLAQLGRAHTKLIERTKRGVVKYQFLQELMPGQDLFDYLNGTDEAPLYRYISLKQAIKILSNALAEMQFIHSKGILHCDIKLENAIYDVKTEKISFVDFGISMTMDKEGQAYFTPLGTQEYMAPEIYDGLYNEGTEIYALGWFFKQVLSHVQSQDRSNDYVKLISKAEEMIDRDRNHRPTSLALKEFLDDLIPKQFQEDKKQEILELKEEKNSIDNEQQAKLDQAIAWLNKAVRFELPEQYDHIETGRKKHLNHIKQLGTDFHMILENSAQIAKEDHFRELVHVVEKEFLRLQKRWCSPSLFSKMKQPEEFIAYLNDDLNHHHYSRMLGLILKIAYENYATLSGEKLLLTSSINDLQFHSKYHLTGPEEKSSLKPLKSIG